MRALDWLKQNAPGFPDMSADERKAILDFALLWGLFELRLLNANASIEGMRDMVQQWIADGKVSAETFESALSYFSTRYIEEGKESYRFVHLHLQEKYKPLVRAVLLRKNKKLDDCCLVVFIIIYRFRNNLFHGTKWTYLLQEQLGNFAHSNAVLMRALELSGPLNT